LLRDAQAHRAALGVLALCTLISLVSRGVGETFAIFLLPISREFQVDRAALTGIYSVYMLGLGFVSPLAGMVFDRLGARISYGIGLGVYGTACLLASSVTALWQLYPLLGLGSAIGASMVGMVPSTSLASRWFHAKLPSAMGILSASLGTGILLFAPIAQALIDGWGWRGAYWRLGLSIYVAMAVVLLMPWRKIDAGSPEVMRARAAAASGTATWTLPLAMRTPVFWALFFVMFFTSISTYAVMVQLVAYLVESGVPPLRAAAVFGVVGMVSIAGMIGAGMLAERIGEVKVAMISYGCTIAGTGALALVSQSPAMAFVGAFVLLFGTMQGSRGPLVATLSARNFAGGKQSGIYGGILFGMGTGGAIGSWGSGKLYDIFGHYLGGFALSAVGAACGLALFLTVPGLGGGRKRAQ
jgi:MFS family permease